MKARLKTVFICVVITLFGAYLFAACSSGEQENRSTDVIEIPYTGNDINSSLIKKHDILKMKADMPRKHMPIPPKPHNVGPAMEKEKIDIENNTYTLEMKVPKKITKKDINVNFKDNILAVSFSGSVELKNNNIEESNIFSVYKSFLVPNTKATIKDIKYNIKDEILKVVVPIIK